MTEELASMKSIHGKSIGMIKVQKTLVTARDLKNKNKTDLKKIVQKSTNPVQPEEESVMTCYN